MVMEPQLYCMKNNSRNCGSLKEYVQDMVEDFKYLEDCHIEGLDLSAKTPRDIASVMD